jgi:hypothetical protein
MATEATARARTLVIDIETSPHLALVWGFRQQNIALNQVRQYGGPISFAAKWLGERRVEFRSTFHDGHDVMVERAWALIDEADAIVHYNGRSFDIKHLNRVFRKAGMGPPSPHTDIDLLLNERRRFRNPSNKLDAVLDDLGLERKVETGGMSLWVGCLEDDPKSWRRMRTYNIGDVRSTEALYWRTLPWIQGLPHPALYGGAADCCQYCGGTDLERRGYKRKPLGKYRQYRCRTCLGWSCGKRAVETVGLRGVA